MKDPASVLLVPKALNTMSKSDKESLSQDMKEASKEQAEESYNNMKKDSSDDKEEHSQERKEKKKKEPQLPVSESSRSITFHSSRGSSHSDDVPPAAVANQLVQVEPDHKVEEGMVDGGSTSGYLMSKLEAKLTKALLGLRITAFVFCLISFSVLAGAKKKGLFQFSFYNFRELKYVALAPSFLSTHGACACVMNKSHLSIFL